VVALPEGGKPTAATGEGSFREVARGLTQAAEMSSGFLERSCVT